MAFCPKCSHEIPATSTICTQCGYDFPLVDPQPIARRMRRELAVLGVLGSVCVFVGLTLSMWIEDAPGSARLAFLLFGLVGLYCCRAFWWFDDRIARLEANASRRRQPTDAAPPGGKSE